MPHPALKIAIETAPVCTEKGVKSWTLCELFRIPGISWAIVATGRDRKRMALARRRFVREGSQSGIRMAQNKVAGKPALVHQRCAAVIRVGRLTEMDGRL